MSKNNKNNKKPAAKTAPKVDPAPKVENPVVETVQTEVVNDEGTKKTVETIAAGKGSASLSLDGQVRLLDLASRRFVENPNAEGKYGKEFVDSMDRLTAAGIVAVFADVAANDTSQFAYVINKSCYPALVSAANSIGVTLPDVKLLAAPVDNNGNVNDNAVVVKTEQIKVSEETKTQAQEEKKIAEQGAAGKIELDPVKVAHMSEEDLKNALTYILVTNLKKHKSPKNALVEAVDFMQAYRLELAEQAENAGEAKEKIAERSMREILQDAFKYVKPTIHLKGIGVGMRDKMVDSGSVLGAFLILRNHMTDKGADKPDWDDQSIADATSVLIEIVAQERVDENKERLASLDPKDKDYKTKKSCYEHEIKENEDILNELSNVSFNVLESDSKSIANDFGRIIEQYFKDVDVAERPRYDNLEANIKMQAGIILNLFRAPGNKNQNYDESNLLEIKKIPLEEYEKRQQEAKKAELETKKAEAAAKQESKNA